MEIAYSKSSPSNKSSNLFIPLGVIISIDSSLSAGQLKFLFVVNTSLEHVEKGKIKYIFKKYFRISSY